MAVYFVDNSISPPSPDGLTWETAFQDIQSAINVSTPISDEVWVKETISPFVLSTPIILDSNIPVYGGFNSALTGTGGSVAGRDLVNDVTVLDGNLSTRIFTFVDECIVDGFYCTRGAGSGGGVAYINGNTGISISNLYCYKNESTSSSFYVGGGAFRTTDAVVVFYNCQFVDNFILSGVRGGAFNCSGSLLEFYDCEFTDNVVDGMGGVFRTTSGGVIFLNNCTIQGNQGTTGGVFTYSSDLYIDGCTFTNNSATVSANFDMVGGYILECTNTLFDNNDSPATVLSNGPTDSNVTYKNCEIVRSDGGNRMIEFREIGVLENCKIDLDGPVEFGIIEMGGSSIENVVTISNCLFHTNNSTGYRNAVIRQYNSNCTLTVTNCTFADNLSEYVLYNLGGNVTIRNCCEWGNVGEFYTNGGTLNVDFCNTESLWPSGSGNKSVDPDFIGTGDDPYDIGPDSGNIDCGDGDSAPNTDILNRPRYDDPNTPNTGVGDPPWTDMGCYEFQGAVVPGGIVNRDGVVLLNIDGVDAVLIDNITNIDGVDK